MREPIPDRLRNLACPLDGQCPSADQAYVRRELVAIACELERTDLDRAVGLMVALDPDASILIRRSAGVTHVDAARCHDWLMPRLASAKSLADLVTMLERAVVERVNELRCEAAAETDPDEVEFLMRQADRLEKVCHG